MKKKVIFCIFISFIASLILYFNFSNKKTYSNYISIMNTNYMPVRDEAPPEYFIDNYREKKDNLSKKFDERDVSAVLKYKALIISHLGEEEIILNGVEKNNIFNINALENIKNNSVIISKKTSKNLNIGIGDIVILKLITKDGHYNAEEYEVLSISDTLNYNYALVDIDNLNNFVKLNDCASEIYLKNNTLDDNIVKQIFGDDFGYYSLNTEKENNNYNNLYFILAYFFILFFSFIFVNNDNLIYSVIFSIIGFVLSLLAYFIIIKYALNTNFYFDNIYLIVLLVNIVSVLSAKLKVFSIKKMFLESAKFSKLILFGFIIVYIFAFVISYDYLLETAQKRTSSNNNVYNIVKKNTSDNTFLLNGSIGDINIINNDVSRVISFPVGVVIRTGSIQSRVYAYDNLNIKYNILSGEMFKEENKEIVIGKYLARYLNLKVGDSVSLIAKNSRGILDTMYFKVVGIYDIDNYNIYANLKTMYDFLHLRGGDKSPYNEKIIIQSKDNIYSYLNKKLKDNNLDELYIEGYDNNIKIFSFILMGLFLISVSLFNSFLLSVFCKASNINKNESIKRYAISFIISMILSLILILLLYDIVFYFIMFLVIIFILSFALTIISSNLLGSDI